MHVYRLRSLYMGIIEFMHARNYIVFINNNYNNYSYDSHMHHAHMCTCTTHTMHHAHTHHTHDIQKTWDLREAITAL